MSTYVVTFQLHRYAGAALFCDTASNSVSLAGSGFWVGGAPEHLPDRIASGDAGRAAKSPNNLRTNVDLEDDSPRSQNALLLLDASCNLSLVSAL